MHKPNQLSPSAGRFAKATASLLAVLICFNAAGSAAEPPVGPEDRTSLPTPRIVFAETSHDFGRVEAGTTLTNVFAFTNTGNAILEVREIQSSCGCAAAEDYTRRVLPGEAGRLTLVFEPGTKSGQVVRHLRVVSNDASQPVVQLNFAATVWKPIDVFPEVAAFGFGPDAQTRQTRVIRFVNNLGKPVTLSEPVFSSPHFEAKLNVVEEGKRFELQVTVIPPLPPGSLSVPITLKTSALEQPEIKVSAYGLVQPAISVFPPNLRLEPHPLTEEQAFSFRIQSQSTNSLTLSEPRLTQGDAVFELQPVRPGKTYVLSVTLPQGFRLPAEESLELTIKSNFALQPVVRIPIVVSALSRSGTEAPAQSHTVTQTGMAPRENEPAN